MALETRAPLRATMSNCSTVLDGPPAETRNFLLLPQLWGKSSGGLSIEMADSVRMATFPHEQVGGGN